jgi:TonB-dependent starch-binding outer membrane protein SusC
MKKLQLLLLAGLLLSVQMLLAQTREVTGKVTDANGAPLNGATIRVKNTRGGTSAAPDGTFKINAAPNAVLIVSAVGFESKDLNIGSQTNVGIQLALDNKALSEVVVTGTGSATTKRKLAIAVESISADKLPAAPTASIDQALVGKIAGAQISSVNGNPGTPVNILLRGINTLQSGTFPMILMDGIEVKATDFQSLDLTSIERIEVIQGAAAATLYGSQGANGVIQLFSKKGKNGRLNIELSSSISRNSLIQGGDFGKAQNHSLKTNGNNEVVDGSNNPLVFDNDYSHYEQNVVWSSLDPTNSNVKAYNKNLAYYDHYKMFFQTATTYNNSISVNGSKDKFDFNLSASDSRQESVFKGNGKFNRSNFTSNIGIELIKNLRFRSTTQLIYTKSTLVDPTGRTIVYALNNARPFANFEYKSPDGNYGAYFGDGVGVNHYNPNYIFQYMHPQDEKLDVIQNFNLNYKFLKFFEADVKYGLNYQNQQIRLQVDPQDNNLNADFWEYWVEGGNNGGYSPRLTYGSPQSKTETGEINIRTYKTTFQNFLPSLTARLDFDRDLGINIPIKSTTFGAFDYRKNVQKNFIQYGTDAPSFSPYTLTSMKNQQVTLDQQVPFITYGYLFDQKFDYGEFGGISGGFRTDYSSAFGKGSKPFTFPHFNGYLRVSSFNFWNKGKIGDIISEFKLRAAYGKAGIQPGPFQRYVTLNTNNVGDNVAFSYKVTSPNPNLNVEVSQETEVGTDIAIKGLKNNWLRNFNLSVSYWNRKTDNAIWEGDVAPSTGVGTIVDNLFGLESHGIQASLNISAYTSKKLNWNFTANFSKQSSEISFVKDKPVVLTSNAGSSGYVLSAGKKIGQLFGFLMLNSVDQVNPETGQPFIPKANQADFSVASNGWVVYSNPSKPNYKQPYVTPNQFSFGDPNPKFNMSFINDLTYAGWINFSMQWDWIYKSHLYNQTKEWMYRDGIHKDYDKVISIGSETGAWTAFYRGVYAQVSRNGTKNYFYENAGFARLRNIALGFDLKKFIKINGINKVQVLFTGRNLVTITNYTGLDPEISSGSFNSAWDRGVDHNSIPNIKSYQVSLNLGF